jgi:hypothetical protein
MLSINIGGPCGAGAGVGVGVLDEANDGEAVEDD